jgi:hypothetical protein
MTATLPTARGPWGRSASLSKRQCTSYGHERGVRRQFVTLNEEENIADPQHPTVNSGYVVVVVHSACDADS